MSKIKFQDLILFEDDNYLVVNKPPLISSLADRNDDNNMLTLARGYIKDAQLCHRLDKETSGALIIAKNPEAYRHVSMQFEKRKVNKIYHAVVDGIHSFDNEICDKSISKLSNGTAGIDKKGKSATTFYNTLQAYKQHTLLECKPITGRMHQIRVHLSSLGASITGDLTYGGRYLYLSSIKRKYNLKKGTEEKPLIQRLALHAFAVGFNDLNDNRIEVEAPQPKDFKVLIKQLDKNS